MGSDAGTRDFDGRRARGGDLEPQKVLFPARATPSWTWRAINRVADGALRGAGDGQRLVRHPNGVGVSFSSRSAPFVPPPWIDVVT